MADNSQVSQGSGTTISTKQDSGGAHHQKALMEYIADSGDPANVSQTTPMPAGRIAVSRGGALPYHSRTLDSAGSNISSAAGRLYSFDAFNNSGANIYLKFYNMAQASIVPASDVPVLGPFLVPAGGGLQRTFSEGIQFENRISVRAVTGLADNNTTSPSANDLLFCAEYK